MFVDKKLSGVKAVQTLSRLNRTMKGKQDTFVLDFVNSEDDILSSFAPFYQETKLDKETDPNTLYDVKSTLDKFNVYDVHDIEQFGGIFYQSQNQTMGDLGKLQSYIMPAIKRFEALETADRDIFKGTLQHFNRLYSFITQVCRLFDKEVHTFSIYAKFLAIQLPKEHQDHVDLDDKIMLEYYRLEKGSHGPIDLAPQEKGLQPITGKVGRSNSLLTTLKDIIEECNKRYGTEFTDMEYVLLQLEQDIAKDPKWQDYGRNNGHKTFRILFDSEFMGIVIKRFKENEEFFKLLLKDRQLFETVRDILGNSVYSRVENNVMNHALPEKMMHGMFELEQPEITQLVADKDAEK